MPYLGSHSASGPGGHDPTFCKACVISIQKDPTWQWDCSPLPILSVDKTWYGHAEADRPEQTMLNFSGLSRQGWIQLCLLLVLTGVLYHRIITNLAAQWYNDPNWSHGFLVPVFCIYVAWRSRDQIKTLSLKPNWLGLIVVLGAMCILVLGVLGAENFLSRASLIFAGGGLLILFGGWSLFRTVLFPWALLFLMIPLPTIVFNQIALPLQFLAARLGSSLLYLAGVPVLREGNIIHLPSLSLDVAEACSGLRSLMSLITLGIFYGYFQEPTLWRRVLLVLSSIPIAIAANGLRIMGSGLLGEYWSPEKAEGFFHAFSGVAVFAVSSGLLILVHRILVWTTRPAQLGLVT